MTYFDAPYRPADLTLNSDSINNSLVGFWALTDGVGSSAVDVSTNGNNATKTGADWESTEIGTAFKNGASSVGLDAGTGVSSLLASSDITVSFWLNSNMSGPRSHVLGNYNGTNGSLLVRRDGGNFRVYKDTGSSVTFTANMIAGSWYHIAFVFNSSGNFKAYVNGTQTQNTGSSRTATDNGQSFQIGSRPDLPTNQTLDGYIQNLRIFNAALTAAQVEQLYIRPWTGTNYDTEALWLSPPASPVLSSASEATSIMSNCVGWWPLVEGSGTVAKDIVGTNDGTITNVDWLDSELGMSSDFQTESNGDHITTNFSAAGQSEITVSFWMRNDGGATPNTYGRLLSMGFLNALDCYINKSSNNSLSFVVNSTNVYFSSLPPIGEWFHFCGVWSQSSHQELYINGSQVATGTADTSVIGSGSHNVIIGGTTSGPRTFHGGIQNVRIWDRALSSSEVALLAERPWIGAEYNESFYLYPPVPSNLTPLDSSSINTDQKLWLPLTDGSGATAVDISGNSYAGTARSSQGWSTTSLGTAANNTSLTNGGFTFGDQADLDMYGDKSFSLWVKPNGGSATQVLFEKRSSSGGLEGYSCYVRYNTDSTVGFLADSGSSTTTASSASALVTDVWSNVCVVVSGNNATIYVNGVAGTTVTNADFAADLSNTVDFVTGYAQRDPSTQDDFDGSVQNVRIWSRALSATEVADIFYSPWLGSAYTGTSSDPATNRFFSPAAFARLG